MPRLSLFRPEKGNDYKFIDKQISEMFQVGGVDVYLHKYLGTKNPTEENSTADQPIYSQVKETNIQDLLFLENRDRVYAPDIIKIRGVYNINDIDFNLSQFALFIDNDTVFMTVHINDFVNIVGRKPISGDVLELPNLRDEFALNDFDVSLPRYYTISDVSRAAEGFSATWYPHLYRLKLTKINSQQQYADILNKPADENVRYLGDYNNKNTYYPGEVIRYEGELYTVISEVTGISPPDINFYQPYSGIKIEDIVSTKNRSLEINDSILTQAEADTSRSGYETRHFYTLQVDLDGNSKVSIADDPTIDTIDKPVRSGYHGYMLDDGVPDNGLPLFGHGISFPVTAQDGDYFLRTDFMPNRLFRYDGSRWIRREDAVRHTLTNNDTYKTVARGVYEENVEYHKNDLVTFGDTQFIATTTNIGVLPTINPETWVAVRSTQKTGFINNNNTSIINGKEVVERQSLSKALRPQADL